MTLLTFVLICTLRYYSSYLDMKEIDLYFFPHLASCHDNT